MSENDDAEWAHLLDVNVVGMARVSAAALPHLRASEHAAIVNVSSVVAAVGVPQRALYSASKGAVAALTMAMAADHVREGIRVNAVLPGTAATPWIGRLLDQADDPDAAAEAAPRAATHRPTGRARRGRPRDRLPRQPAQRLHHRHPARRRRRDEPAPAPELSRNFVDSRSRRSASDVSAATARAWLNGLTVGVEVTRFR